MARRVARIKSLVGVNSLELERRLAIAREHKDTIAGWFKVTNYSKADIRANLIDLLNLDTGDLTSHEAAKSRVRAFSAFFYGSHLETPEEYDEVTTKLIDALGDTAEYFFREKQGPYGPRATYKERTSRNNMTGDLVKVFNNGYLTVDTVTYNTEDIPEISAQPQQEEEILVTEPTRSTKHLERESEFVAYYLLDSVPQNDVDILVSSILTSLYAAADKSVLTNFMLATDPYSELLNIDVEKYSDTLVKELSRTTASGFLNRIRKLLLLK
jgi:hypothetical protein